MDLFQLHAFAFNTLKQHCEVCDRLDGSSAVTTGRIRTHMSAAHMSADTAEAPGSVSQSRFKLPRKSVGSPAQPLLGGWFPYSSHLKSRWKRVLMGYITIIYHNDYDPFFPGKLTGSVLPWCIYLGMLRDVYLISF